MHTNNTVYQIVTDKIVAMLKEGKIPWHKTWESKMPTNLISKKPYRGVNPWLLMNDEFKSQYWLTFKQAQAIGGNIRRGEKGRIVTFWKIQKFDKAKNDGTIEEKTFPLLRYYKVFNLEQCEGVVEPESNKDPINPIESCEKIVKGYKDPPLIKNHPVKAFYSPYKDEIGIPDINQFNKPEEYYSVLFHEMTHSTGHDKRLSRDTLGGGHFFGSESYSKEELVAEIGASYLCNLAGIDNIATMKNSVAYLQAWMTKLKDDNTLIVKASSKAQKSTDFILGVS